MNDMMKKHIYEFLIKFEFVNNVEMEQKKKKKLQMMEQLRFLFEKNKKEPHYPPDLY